MAAFDLAGRIAERGQKVGVGAQDGAVEPELNHSLGAVHRCNLGFEFAHVLGRYNAPSRLKQHRQLPAGQK